MIESETDKAWEENKTTLTEADKELSKKEQDKKRMAELRARKKPPKMVGVHPSILALPDDHYLSHKKIKQWIETQQGIAKSAGQTERSRHKELSQRKRDEAMRERMGAEGYIRSMKRYLRTGDWDSLYWGEYEQNLTKWKVIAPAGGNINSNEDK
tara:strand:+ start:1653 stop:2117 length:465 start_codon:yes stop_codon:yes gene_type:complete